MFPKLNVKNLCSFIVIFLLSNIQAEPLPVPTVMQLNEFDGAVTVSPTDTDDWITAEINRPITTGDRIWVDDQSHAELHKGAMALRLAALTHVDILNLSAQTTQLELLQGTLSLYIRTLKEGDIIEVDTPNLAFNIDRPGKYRIDVDPENNQAIVTVREGEGTAYGENNTSYLLDHNQRVIFSGTQLTTEAINPAADVIDEFDHWVEKRNRLEHRYVSEQYLSHDITGYEMLDQYGTWHDEPGYGPVWTPINVSVNWVPYRNGHWTWIDPWGWTWIDDAPWGFAPCHYGRWARIRDSWSWVPPKTHSDYAPAHVVFITQVINKSTVVAWFPLAPGETYHTYQDNRHAHQQEANVHYTNQRDLQAITVVSANSFIHGQPVHRSMVPVSRVLLTHSTLKIRPDLAPSYSEKERHPQKQPQRMYSSVHPVIATQHPIPVWHFNKNHADSGKHHAIIVVEKPSINHPANSRMQSKSIHPDLPAAVPAKQSPQPMPHHEVIVHHQPSSVHDEHEQQHREPGSDHQPHPENRPTLPHTFHPDHKDEAVPPHHEVIDHHQPSPAHDEKHEKQHHESMDKHELHDPHQEPKPALPHHKPDEAVSLPHRHDAEANGNGDHPHSPPPPHRPDPEHEHSVKLHPHNASGHPKSHEENQDVHPH